MKNFFSSLWSRRDLLKGLGGAAGVAGAAALGLTARAQTHETTVPHDMSKMGTAGMDHSKMGMRFTLPEKCRNSAATSSPSDKV